MAYNASANHEVYGPEATADSLLGSKLVNSSGAVGPTNASPARYCSSGLLGSQPLQWSKALSALFRHQHHSRGH